MSKSSALSAIAIAAVLAGLAASTARATVFIGLQQDAGPIVTVVSSPTPASPLQFAGTFGNFEGVNISAIGQPGTVAPVLLQTSSLVVNNVALANAGVLSIYITSTGNTDPLGQSLLTSGFAAVNLVPGWSETLETYLDPGNGVYALTTLLGSASFNTVDSSIDTFVADTGAGPFSITAVCHLSAPALGSASSQIGISGVLVPEPGPLTLLGAALIGLTMVVRIR